MLAPLSPPPQRPAPWAAVAAVAHPPTHASRPGHPTLPPSVPASPARETSGHAGTSRKISVDRESWSASVDGHPLDLTFMEFEVLDFLTRNPGRVYSRGDLLRIVWGYRSDSPVPGGRAVDVLVARLRRKLGPEHRDLVQTVRRVGYRYAVNEAASKASTVGRRGGISH